MLARNGSAITFHAFYTEAKVGKTGLTVTVDVWKVTTGGVSTQIVTADPVTAVGGGLYRYTLAGGAVDAAGEYLAIFKTSTTSVDQQHLPAIWVIDRRVNAQLQDCDADAIKAAGIQNGAITSAKAPNLDAAVSTRSTYAGGDTTGTTTLLSRLSVQRASNLDNLDAAVSTRSTYAGADTAGTTTLLGLLTPTRAAKLDNLDAAVSSRLPTASYVAAPTAAQIWTSPDRQLTAFAFQPTVGAYAAGKDPWTIIAAGVVEGSITFVEASRLWNAVLGGKALGLDVGPAKFRDPADTKDRVSATVDQHGNRTAVTLDLS